MSGQIDITVIVECANEGRFIHPAVKAVVLALENVRKDLKLNVDCLVVASKPSAEMTEYLKQTKPDFVTTLTVDEPKMAARNAAVRKVAGQFIAIVDGNDMIAPDWLLKAYAAAKQGKQPAVYHPALIIEFGESSKLYLMPDQDEPEFSQELLFARNLWPGPMFAKKEILLSEPFVDPDSTKGFGHADWYWSCQTVASGVVHKAVADTFACCHSNKQHRCVAAETNAPLLMPPSKLFQVFPTPLKV